MMAVLTSAIWLTALFSCALKVQSQVTARISPEEDYNAPVYPNKRLRFDCEASERIVQWLVNGLFASDAEVVNKSVITTPAVEQNGGLFLSSLVIPARQENHNTTIQCRTADVDSSPVPVVYSRLVFLRIQGLLGPPPNLSLTEVDDQLTRRLTWDAPETLDLTDIEPDIEFYQVCYNLSSDDLTCVNVSSSERREFIFPNVCVPLIFTVTAFNVVGEGNASRIVHNGSNGICEKDSLIGSTRHLASLIRLGKYPTVTLLITQNVLDLQEACTSIYKVQTSLINTSESNTTNHGPQIPKVVSYSKDSATIELSLTVNSDLMANEIFTATITIISEGYTCSSATVEFSTYDIQAVDISALPGGLELSCTFANGSQARSCILTVCGMENEVIDEGSCVNVTITRSAQALTSSTRHVVSLPGVYSIREVIEVERDGEMTIVRLIEDPGLANTTTEKNFSISGATSILAVRGMKCIAMVWILILVTVCLTSKT